MDRELSNATKLLTQLIQSRDTALTSLLPRRSPLSHLERNVESDCEVLINNLRYAIYDEYQKEMANNGPTFRASEAIILQRLEQGPLQCRTRVPSERPEHILDLSHHQDTERLPEDGVQGLCCGKKHYYKGAAYDTVLPVTVRGEVALFPFNAGDNPYEIGAEYCRRNGIHEFAVLERIVQLFKEGVPEQFLNLTPIAPSHSDRRKPATTFVPIQRQVKKKAKKEKKETSIVEDHHSSNRIASSTDKRVEEIASAGEEHIVTPAATGTAGNDTAMEDNPCTDPQNIADQLRMAQERRRQEHTRKRQEETARAKAAALETERQLVREYAREQEERFRIRKELEGLTHAERLSRLMEQLKRIEDEELAERYAGNNP